MRPREVPSYSLKTYTTPQIAELGIFAGRWDVVDAKLNRPPGPHRHEHFELFWLRGPGVLVNDFERYVLPPDRPTFILISPGQMHCWCGSQTIRGSMVSFTEGFFDAPPNTLREYGFVHRTAYPPWLLADDEFIAEAEPLMDQCGREFARRASRWADVMRATLHVLMVAAHRAYQKAAPETPEALRSRRLVQRFQAEIEERFSASTTVADFAKTLGISAGHLNDTVRELTGATAGELIRNRIMLEARRLLYHSDLLVSEIAYRLGFDDPSYFAKTFKKATGQAPAAFRSDIRENHYSNRE